MKMLRNLVVGFYDSSIKKILTVSSKTSERITKISTLEKPSLPRALVDLINTISCLNNNWIYTTNHKRIGINYFNFVLVSGTAGMGLASLVRIELAYPGIGVLCGDSIQYLTLATGHGVIMVFYMIMPVLFGAFANFLLPTQLGVHDVAFPRLNSAAFWFLPGGLIILLHIVCVDRRYQRLNYFNIREMGAVLKRKYFNDLVNTNDHRTLLEKTIIGTKFKTQNVDSLKGPLFLFMERGTSTTPKDKTSRLLNSYYATNLSKFEGLSLIKLLQNKYDLEPALNTLLNSLVNQLWLLFNLLNRLFVSINNLLLPNGLSLSKCWLGAVNLNTGLKSFDSTNFRTLGGGVHTDSVQLLKPTVTGYNSSNINHVLDILNISVLSNTESSNHFRWISFNSPRIGCDYKRGFYPKNIHHRYPMQVSKLDEINKIPGTLRAPWYLLPGSGDSAGTGPLMFYKTFSKVFIDNNFKFAPFNDPKSKVGFRFSNPKFLWDKSTSHILPIDTFFSFGFVNNACVVNMSTRWVSTSALSQKYQNMFDAFSTQQRLLSKWRELKFTREAWRCKLLLGRNQNVGMRSKKVFEGSIVWSIERNAKDLIPGWAMVTPFSSRLRYTLPGKVDMGLVAVFLAINASIISSANFLVTYRYLSTLNNRKMRDARSFFSESIIVASWMMIAANPMLAIGILMLLSDRHWKTCFFDYSGGGDAVLFQHMFWFFGHPEVYVIMIPVFGFTNTFLSYYLRKRISARASLMYSMYTIAFLGFWVWGHHMYMVGLSHTTRMLFSTLTVMISVPAATKLQHWCVTIVNSTFIVEIPLLYTLAFIFFFVSGGISGMCVAHTGMDVLFHDTFYVIGHFHVMLAGAAMLGIFGAFYFYFPAIYGFKYSRLYAYVHFIYYLLGQLLTVIPMMWLGYCGMPRRVFDYPYVLGGWHSIATSGHLLSVAAILSFFVMIYDSVRQGKAPIRTTFGVARFNTRLNFFYFAQYRHTYIQQKGWYLNRFNGLPHQSIYAPRGLSYTSVLIEDVTYFSYSLYDEGSK